MSKTTYIVVWQDSGKSVGTNYVWRPLAPFNWGTGITLVENSVDNWLLEPGQWITYFATTTWVVWMACAGHYNFSRMRLTREHWTSPELGCVSHPWLHLQNKLHDKMLQMCQSCTAMWAWLFLQSPLCVPKQQQWLKFWRYSTIVTLGNYM